MNGTTDATSFVTRTLETPRHRTAWLEAGPPMGPLLIFVHGWPELGLVWRHQLEHFAKQGFRCIAPDMRGYGGSSVPPVSEAYTMREIVQDLLELHDGLGGAPALWVGHDWGSSAVWALAAHHAPRCRGVVSLCVPYLARGFALRHLVPLVDRETYPEDEYPLGQWDYVAFYNERFEQAALDHEADVEATLKLFFRHGSPDSLGKRAITSDVRARGGFYGPARRAPELPRDPSMLPGPDFEVLVEAFRRTGFRGADAWYVNEADNLAYAAEAKDGGLLTMPVLFLHAAWDAICETVRSRLAEPMRADCADLREVLIDGGHELMLEKPAEVNAAIDEWLAAKNMSLG